MKLFCIGLDMVATTGTLGTMNGVAKEESNKGKMSC